MKATAESLQAAKTQAVFLHAGSLPACFGPQYAALVVVTSQIMKLGYGKTLATASLIVD